MRSLLKKLLDSAKKSATDAIKTAEATGGLLGRRTADKITNTWSKNGSKDDAIPIYIYIMCIYIYVCMYIYKSYIYIYINIIYK